MSGAIDIESCPNKRQWGNRWHCGCVRCAKCGEAKHVAIHGPRLGEHAGSQPWGHEYVEPWVKEAGR